MEPLSTSAALTSKPVEGLSSVAKLSETRVPKIAPVEVADVSGLRISALVENLPISETHASFFSDPVFKELRADQLPDLQGVRLQWGEQTIDISLQEGDLLDTLGVKNVLSYAMNPAIDQFTQIRLAELETNVPSAEDRLEQATLGIPARIACAVSFPQANGLLGALEKASQFLADKHDHFLVARRIDYLVGSQYIPGKICDLPLAGGISNWVFKEKLALEMESADWSKLGDDVLMIVSIAALPLAPATGGLSMAGYVAANAAFGAIGKGCISYLSDRNETEALKDAGKGALLGAVGGLGGAAAAGKLVPAISNKLLASAASGSTIGASTAATEATIRVIEAGESLDTAVAEVVEATLAGGLGGAVLGSSFHGVTNILNKLGIARPLAEASLANQAKRYEKFLADNSPEIPPNGVVHAGTIRNYARKLDTVMDEFAAHLVSSNQAFRSHVEKLATKLSAAQSDGDTALIAKLERQLKQGLSGEFAEAKVRAMFEPFFEKISAQMRVKDGATIIDMVLEGAKHPIAIKGHRLVEVGGSLPVEVKAGLERYFKSEIDSGHLLKQLRGHTEFGNGLVIATRDVSDALMKAGARQFLKEAGSAPYRLLPQKEEIDAAMSRLVSRLISRG